jgi:hypothetical protein
VAEVNKAGFGKTQARTRFLCLSNSKRGRKIITYGKGVTAIKELIGKAEDISRFDFAIMVADNEIDQTWINEQLYKKVEHKYLSELCHNLVMWSWTRKTNDVIFADGAEKTILDLALELTERYDSSIPLVTPAVQRVKLARLSIALACRLFSTSDGENVIVTPAHAEVVYDFLRQCYDKPSMAYDLYSESKDKPNRWITEHKQEIIDNFVAFKACKDWKQLRDILLEYEIIKKSELELQLGWSDADTRDFFGWASRNRLMFSTHQGYAKHPLWIQILKELGKEDL